MGGPQFVDHSLIEGFWVIPVFEDCELCDYKPLCAGFCVNKKFLFLGVRLLDWSYVNVYLMIEETAPNFFPKWLYHFVFPVTM